MNLYQGLLFLHGHIANADLAVRLSAADAAAPTPDRDSAAPPARRTGRRWLRNLWLLGGRPMTAGRNFDLEEPLLPCMQRTVCRTLAAGGFR